MKRIVICLIVTAVAAFGWLWLSPRHAEQTTSPATQPTTTRKWSTPPSPTAASTTNSVGDDDQPADAQPKQIEVAERFCRAWLDTSGGHAAWLSRMRPVVTVELAADLAHVNDRNIPPAQLTGTQPGAADQVSTQVLCTTSRADLVMSVWLQWAGEKWEVVSYDLPN